MKQTDTRPLFSIPWADQADSSTIATIPQSATAIGRASMALGFPKATMTPIAAGGVPPYGEDMNGILNMLSRAARTAELGILHPFSADYATAINGYPVGATIAHPTIAGRFLICTADNNTNDPSQSMNGWLDPLGNYAT
ncbi:phage tail protein, partial [Bombella sp. TMW 2.2558]|nr:phage tail protein [Bombella saccharophila]